MLDWQASEAHAVDLLAQKEYSQQRTRDRKVERIHLETCSGAYFVRPSDNQVIEGIDEDELAYRAFPKTAKPLHSTPQRHTRAWRRGRLRCLGTRADAGLVGAGTNGETATLLKTLATQVPLDVLHGMHESVEAEAAATKDELDAFDTQHGGLAADSDDE